MDNRERVLRALLLLYALASAVSALLLALSIGKVGELRHTTSGKILAAALLTLGFGALMAARAPRRQKTVIQMLIVFASLSALAVVYRLVTERHYHDLAWLALAPVVAAPILLALYYPSPRPEHVEVAPPERGEDAGDGGTERETTGPQRDQAPDEGPAATQ